MVPTEAEGRLVARLGSRLRAMTLADALAAMVSFYVDERAYGCDLEDDGDMLLVEWGTFGLPADRAFTVSVTRQFMRADGRIAQLHLRARWPISDLLSPIQCGNLWCGSPADAEGFAQQVEAVPGLAFAHAQPWPWAVAYEEA